MNMRKEVRISDILSRVGRYHRIEEVSSVKNKELLDFFKSAYSDQFNAAGYKSDKDIIRRWEWMNCSNPNISRQASSWICRNSRENKIVGHFGVSPVSLKFDNSYYSAVWGRDLVVLPEFRRLGIGPFLVDRVLNNVKDGAALFLIAGLNDYVYTIYKKFGFFDLGHIPLYVRIVNLKEVLNRKTENAVVSYLLGSIGGRLLKFLYTHFSYQKRFIEGDKTLLITKIDSFSSDFDKLWEKTSCFFPIIVRRDSRFLNWRFACQPFWEYSIFKAEDRKSKELKGYLVLRKGRSGGMRAGIISDLFACPEDSNTIASLVNFSIEYFERENDVDIIRCNILHKQFARLLKNFGFLNIRSNSRFMLVNFNLKSKSSSIADTERWFINYADSDLDLF